MRSTGLTSIVMMVMPKVGAHVILRNSYALIVYAIMLPSSVDLYAFANSCTQVV